MKRVKDRRVKDRQRTELFSAYVQGLPVQRRGEVILVLWMNAVLTLVLDAAWLLLVARAMRRATGRHGRGLATVLDTAHSHGFMVIAGASGVHQLARDAFMRSLDRRARRVVWGSTRRQRT